MTTARPNVGTWRRALEYFGLARPPAQPVRWRETLWVPAGIATAALVRVAFGIESWWVELVVSVALAVAVAAVFLLGARRRRRSAR